MNKNNTNFILISSALLLIFFAGSFFYFFNVIKNKNKHISAVSVALDKKISEKNNINILEKKMGELIDIKNNVSSHIVDPTRVDIFVESLEQIGVNSGTELFVKNVSVSKKEKNIIQVSLSIKGSFVNVTKAIILLENSPYSIIVSSFYLNKDMEQDSGLSSIPGKKEDINLYKLPTWQASVNFSALSLE